MERKRRKDCNRRLNRDPASGTIHSESYRQNSELMKKSYGNRMKEEKDELNVLQSQINPHFLYNTLDSITWMIESGKMRKRPL